MRSVFFLFCLILKFSSAFAEGNEKLVEDLQHDAERQKAYASDMKEKKQQNNDRDKALALQLEEEEQWETQREKGLLEYKKQKRQEPKTSFDEDSKEYKADLKEKIEAEKQMEVERKKQVAEKQKILKQYSKNQILNEEDELNVFEKRPRYDLRKRASRLFGHKSTAKLNTSSGGGSFNYNFPPPTNDYNQMPAENYDDFPPLPSYDNTLPGATFDSGFGDAPLLPPPPPPIDNFDF